MLCGKYCLIHLEIVKRPKNENITLKSYLKQDNVAPTPTQLYLVSIRFRRKISFVMSFTISN